MEIRRSPRARIYEKAFPLFSSSNCASIGTSLKIKFVTVERTTFTEHLTSKI